MLTTHGRKVGTCFWHHVTCLVTAINPSSRAEGGHLLLPAPRGLHCEARHDLVRVRVRFRARARARGRGRGRGSARVRVRVRVTLTTSSRGRD